MEGEFHDWEKVEIGVGSEVVISPNSTEDGEEIETQSEGLFRVDYFSLKNEAIGDGSKALSDSFENESESVKASWIDPGPAATRNILRDASGSWSDTCSDPSDGRIVEEVDENKETPHEFENSGNMIEEEDRVSPIEENSLVAAAPKEVSKLAMWWKLPFEMLKQCVIKIGPFWSLSMAAAIFGFALLGRRLYKMKRKAQNMRLKAAVAEKVMGRAAKLNEVVPDRRVPIFRPLLPPAGVNSWPVMTLR